MYEALKARVTQRSGVRMTPRAQYNYCYVGHSCSLYLQEKIARICTIAEQLSPVDACQPLTHFGITMATK